MKKKILIGLLLFTGILFAESEVKKYKLSGKTYQSL